MEKHQDKLRLATIVLFSALMIGFGLYAPQTPMLLAGTTSMIYCLGASCSTCRQLAPA